MYFIILEESSESCEKRLNCHKNAHCVKNKTQTMCQCFEGYYGDGILCTRYLAPPDLSLLKSSFLKRECKSQNECHENATCVHAENEPYKFICRCLDGYQGDGFNECIKSGFL